MRMNVKTRTKAKTHEGAPATAGFTPLDALKRSVLACLLYEKEFYEDGIAIAERIRETAAKCKPEDIAALAVTARNVHNLRHVPLLLLEVLTRTGAGKPGLVSGAIAHTVQRADELAEFMAIYMGGQKRPLSGQTKKGLALAIEKFDAYQLAKYDRDGAWKLRDVVFMAHAKPSALHLEGAKRAKKVAKIKGKKRNVVRHKGNLLEQLIEGKLATPDTWEVGLSGGGDKKEVFETLLREGKLGYLALLRNLRNMEQAGVDRALIKSALEARKGARRVLPFRYVAAARAAPSLEPVIDRALCAAIAELPPFKGHTGILVDVSGSMDVKLSGKSDLTRMDAAATLASVINGEDLTVATFSNMLAIIPPRRGMAGVEAVITSQPHGGTELGASVREFERRAVQSHRPFDRLIVISDEQSHDRVAVPSCPLKYMINVASYKNGVGYGGGWRHIDGFSEGVLKYIHAVEAAENGDDPLASSEEELAA